VIHWPLMRLPLTETMPPDAEEVAPRKGQTKEVAATHLEGCYWRTDLHESRLCGLLAYERKETEDTMSR
jgi:hypothetical protein